MKLKHFCNVYFSSAFYKFITRVSFKYKPPITVEAPVVKLTRSDIDGKYTCIHACFGINTQQYFSEPKEIKYECIQ